MYTNYQVSFCVAFKLSFKLNWEQRTQKPHTKKAVCPGCVQVSPDSFLHTYCLMKCCSCLRVLRCEGHFDNVPFLLCKETQYPSLAIVAHIINLQEPAIDQCDLTQGHSRTLLSTALFLPHTDTASAGVAICFAIHCHTWGAKVRDAQQYHSGSVLHPIRESDMQWYISWCAITHVLTAWLVLIRGNVDSQHEYFLIVPLYLSYFVREVFLILEIRLFTPSALDIFFSFCWTLSEQIKHSFCPRPPRQLIPTH